MNLSDLRTESPTEWESVDLSGAAPGGLILSESVSIGTKYALLRLSLNEDGLSLLDQEIEIPSESVWQCTVDES
jgi:hypothetical protein